MGKNKKIAVFIGDFFWSSIPYDGLNLYHRLVEEFDVDLIMFKRDIRLNKLFTGVEKYHFNINFFKNIKNLKEINDWSELDKISNDYKLIICSSHIAPKTRYPISDSNKTGKNGAIARCPVAVWDIGGIDMLTNGTHFANYFFVKGAKWKEWLISFGNEEKNVFITGSPHYDNFFDSKYNVFGPTLNSESFYKKYDLKKDKEKILLMPTNPASHKQQFEESAHSLHGMVDLCAEKNIELLIKTYPHDYVFYENTGAYTGVYKRIYSYSNIPQYEFIRNKHPTVKIIESQDHFAAIKYVDKIFNMAGSSVAWETCFTDSVSYATNYKKQKYYKKLSYLPDYVELPDEYTNVHVENVNQIVEGRYNSKKEFCSEYFLNEVSIPGIVNSIKQILTRE